MDECRRLALAGEEEIKQGNTRAGEPFPAITLVLGIEQLEKALKAGTADTVLLSAIYSQLGNGYYALREYECAVRYHANDLMLSQ